MKVEETSHCTSTIYDQTSLVSEAAQRDGERRRERERGRYYREDGVRQTGAGLVLVILQMYNTEQQKLDHKRC